MDDAERAIAFLLGPHDRAKRHHVRQRLEADVAFRHLFPDRIRMFLAPRNLGLDACARQQLFEPGRNLEDLVVIARAQGIEPLRSEEHTSELQSLMRISYAVFCLKKKKKTNNI